MRLLLIGADQPPVTVLALRMPAPGAGMRWFDYSDKPSGA